MHRQPVVGSAQRRVSGKSAVLRAGDDLLRVLAPDAHGKRLLFELRAALFQEREQLAGAVTRGKDERIGLKRFLRAAVRETHRAQRLTGKLDIRELCAEAHLAAVGKDHFTKPLHGVRQTVGADVRLGLPENFVRRSGLYEIVQHLPAALIVRAGVELAV